MFTCLHIQLISKADLLSLNDFFDESQPVFHIIVRLHQSSALQNYTTHQKTPLLISHNDITR
jgi:hypothetical protein